MASPRARFLKDTIFQQVEQKCVDLGSHRLHNVERERIAIALIGMQDAERWIAAACEQCEAASLAGSPLS